MKVNPPGWGVHVLPHADRRTHVGAFDCWCEPTVDDRGTIVHHAADKRESLDDGGVLVA